MTRQTKNNLGEKKLASKILYRKKPPLEERTFLEGRRGN